MEQRPNVLGAMLPSRPTGILLCHFWNSKKSQFIAVVLSQNVHECVIMQVTKGALISA